MKTLGQKIKEARQENKLTLDELSSKSGVSKAYLSQLENNESEKPSADKLYSIAVILGVSMAELLGKKLVKIEESDRNTPKTLEKAAVQFSWSLEEKSMLANILLRSNKSKKNLSIDDWRYLYETIKRITKEN